MRQIANFKAKASLLKMKLASLASTLFISLYCSSVIAAPVTSLLTSSQLASSSIRVNNEDIDLDNEMTFEGMIDETFGDDLPDESSAYQVSEGGAEAYAYMKSFVNKEFTESQIVTLDEIVQLHLAIVADSNLDLPMNYNHKDLALLNTYTTELRDSYLVSFALKDDSSKSIQLDALQVIQKKQLRNLTGAEKQWNIARAEHGKVSRVSISASELLSNRAKSASFNTKFDAASILETFIVGTGLLSSILKSSLATLV